MVRKTKIAKLRQDKFYKLAKETGYRSRSAFKLVQLNRKFEFLQKSRVLIDLCAAPGGWLQVASKFMPISSLIIGVDLVSIKSLPNVITLEEDITTVRCRQMIKKELKTWKADCVLHDGSPNVGQNWLHDAFQQAQLTLSALKIATIFLRKGGCFVTKLFRSKDYNAVVWVFKQFFKKVYATKPQASRIESAEIFVVCLFYLAPDKIDPKFMDIKYVFKDVEVAPKTGLNLMFPQKKVKAEGYEDGVELLYKKLNVSNFLSSDNYLEILSKCTEVVFDDDSVANNSLTTNEIKECCKDIKVLGRRELRLLLTWRKNIIKFIEDQKPKSEKTEPEVKITSEDEEEAELQEVQKQIKELKESKVKDMKRKKKKVLKTRQKLQTKLNLKMIVPNDRLDAYEEDAMFKMSLIKSKKDLSAVEKGEIVEAEKNEEELAEYTLVKSGQFDPRYDTMENSDLDEDDSSVEDLKNDYGKDDDGEAGSTDSGETLDDENPLIVDLDHDDHATKIHKRMNLWFKHEAFSGIDNEADEEYDIEVLAQVLKDRQLKLSEEADPVEEDKRDKNLDAENENVSDLSDDSELDEEDENDSKRTKMKINPNKRNSMTVPEKLSKLQKRKLLDPAGLTIGTMIATSKKNKRDVMDDAYNRYTNNDENLPDWFATDEKKHYKRNLPITKEFVRAYKERIKEINARPIKKVVEAKARKKRRSMNRLEKAKKQIEAITDSVEMTEIEKMHHIKSIYKKAGIGVKKKKKVTYVVAKKSGKGIVRRPRGVKGHFRMVDKRLKKDKIAEKRSEERKKKKR